MKLVESIGWWKKALRLVWEASPGYAVGWGGILIVQGVLPVIAVYLSKFAVDSLVAAKNSNGSWPEVANALLILALLGGIVVLTEIARHASTWLRTAQAESFADFLADKIHRKAAEVDLAYYESPEYHDLMEQARGESSTKPLALLDSLGAAIQNGISIGGMGVLVASYAWWLPLVLIVGSVPALYLSARTDRMYHKWWRSRADDRRWIAYYDAILTHANAAQEMRLFNLSSHFRESYQSLRKRLRREKLERLHRQELGRIVATFIGLSVAVAATCWMAFRVLYGAATLGDLVVFYQIFSRAQGLTSSLLQGVGKTFNHSLYLANLFKFLDLRPAIVSPEEPARPLRQLRKGIRFRSVSFQYPGSATPAIENLDLFVPAGKIVALVGVNGAGKTTLIKLLSRFYDPTKGAIEIDGIDIRRFDLLELRRMMSVLFQFPMQYHATAGENVALGDVQKTANETEILEATRHAGAHAFISKLPDGYGSLLGKWFVNGVELSGGEWQRLALARAYFRQAPIVMLDEPTSFMDSWSEVDWFERLRSITAGHTGIVITHRFTIAMRADMIHVIDGGRILESGTHLELLEKNGFYAESWETQLRVSEGRQNGSGLNRRMTGPYIGV